MSSGPPARGAGPLVPQCAVILTSVNCYESQGHCPELRQRAEVKVRISSAGHPKGGSTSANKRPFDARFRPWTRVNSIGKEAILRARQAEMFAQRHPFVVAAKQAAML